jgi:NTP pyrophosphatase (non-canonical NTP hydrolase)
MQIKFEDLEVTFAKHVDFLVKSPHKLKSELEPLDCDILHMLIGLQGEVGELTDCLKKRVIYRQMLDWENLVEELGDIEFYLQRIRTIANVSRGEVLLANIKKLQARYGGSYSDDKAKSRADKHGQATKKKSKRKAD